MDDDGSDDDSVGGVGENAGTDLEPQGHVVYPSVAALVIIWTKLEPVSVVVSLGEQGHISMHCCAKVSGKKQALEVRIAQDADRSWHFGMCYHKMVLVEDGEAME